MQAILLDPQDLFLSEQDLPDDVGVPDFLMQGTTVFQHVPVDALALVIYRQLDVYVLAPPTP